MKTKLCCCLIFFSLSVYAIPRLVIGKDSLEQLISLNIVKKNTPVKLHLGCGLIYKEGYVNIDFPPSNHTIQKHLVADAFADITKLKFPDSTIQEIRLHHVFEHFFRQTALALLCAWNTWLSVGGTLCIEVPDFDACINKLVSDHYSYSQKELIRRHVFGSHEASWAVHCDGWSKIKFEHVLSRLGFSEISFEFNNELLSNLTVHAKKNKILGKEKLRAAAHELLKDSQNGPNDINLWQLWCQQFNEELDAMVIV